MRSEKEELKKRIEKLERKLKSRIIVEKAKGYLMEWTGSSEESAYIVMRRLSMDTGRSIRDIAEGIIFAWKCIDMIKEGD